MQAVENDASERVTRAEEAAAAQKTAANAQIAGLEDDLAATRTKLAELLSATTQVDVSAGWFTERYALMFGISALLTFVLLLLTGALR